MAVAEGALEQIGRAGHLKRARGLERLGVALARRLALRRRVGVGQHQRRAEAAREQAGSEEAAEDAGHEPSSLTTSALRGNDARVTSESSQPGEKVQDVRP